jgi:photosystem II stability/assembly factor-like uncharacterized protein
VGLVLAALTALPVSGHPAEKEKATTKTVPTITADTLKGLEFRNIGPALMGGRIDDFAVVESAPSTFYVATASGGVLKTTNNGITFDPVFDDQDVSTIGDIAIAPSDPSILYVGTGEPNNRQSSSWGNGVYKTLDGGKTWGNVGLKDTQHIGRVVVDRRNPDVAYVAALGHLWGPNKERGLFKTTDGGKSWSNTRFIDEDTGFVDVAMDPESSQTLYAASYQRRRTAFGYSGGGPGSGLWKTVDGGATWKKLTKGLPAEGDVGRIGLAVYRKDARIVYALVEHAKEGGIYRSEDKGESWTKMSATNPRPSYYSQVHIDPNNDQRIWVLGAPMFYSEDGGKTFKNDLVQKIHGDYHGLWIDPVDSNHMIVGTDGGIHVSYDRGRSMDFVNTVPLAQFYEVSLDNRQPYWVYGGLQDNGSWMGPSRTLHTQGIANEDWIRVGGGDGFYCVVDPTDPTIVYLESQDGNLSRIRTDTFERRTLRPEDPQGEKYRFNWDSPILISPHDPKTIYYGGNRLFGSTDRGESWTLKTPDLTNGAERDKLTIFGKVAKDLLSRNDGVVHFGTITTLAESPLKAGVLWAGTDDGNLQISKDAGASWANVASRVPGLPKGTYVSRVEASRTSEGAAYVAFDGHRSNDFGIYLFRTEDYGQTWKAVSGNIPVGGTVSVVREHPANPDLLLVGTEYGLWMSWNRGGHWVRIKSKLPTVPVDDIQIHPRDGDLVLATHGRGVWVLDDMAPLAALRPDVLASDLHVFEIRPATQYRIYNHKGDTGHKFFLAPNPPDGALISFHLKAKPGDKDELKVVVKDAAGNVVREIKEEKGKDKDGDKDKKDKKERDAGINRVNWDLRHEPPVPPDPELAFFGPPKGPFVPPGIYSVTVSMGAASATKTVVVEEDPRIHVDEADRKAWYDSSVAAAKLWKRADTATKAMESLKKQLTELQESLKKDAKTPEAVTTSLKALGEKVELLAKRLKRQAPLGFAGAPLAEDPEPLLDKARGLYFTASSITAPLTAQHGEALARASRSVDEVVVDVNAVLEQAVPALNKLMLDNAMGKLDAAKKLE